MIFVVVSPYTINIRFESRNTVIMVLAHCLQHFERFSLVLLEILECLRKWSDSLCELLVQSTEIIRALVDRICQRMMLLTCSIVIRGK